MRYISQNIFARKETTVFYPRLTDFSTDTSVKTSNGFPKSTHTLYKFIRQILNPSQKKILSCSYGLEHNDTKEKYGEPRFYLKNLVE